MAEILISQRLNDLIAAIRDAEKEGSVTNTMVAEALNELAVYIQNSSEFMSNVLEQEVTTSTDKAPSSNAVRNAIDKKTLKAVSASSDQATTTLKVTSNEKEVSTIIPLATKERAGVISAADKITLEKAATDADTALTGFKDQKKILDNLLVNEVGTETDKAPTSLAVKTAIQNVAPLVDGAKFRSYIETNSTTLKGVLSPVMLRIFNGVDNIGFALATGDKSTDRINIVLYTRHKISADTTDLSATTQNTGEESQINIYCTCYYTRDRRWLPWEPVININSEINSESTNRTVAGSKAVFDLVNFIGQQIGLNNLKPNPDEQSIHQWRMNLEGANSVLKSIALLFHANDSVYTTTNVNLKTGQVTENTTGFIPIATDEKCGLMSASQVKQIADIEGARLFVNVSNLIKKWDPMDLSAAINLLWNLEDSEKYRRQGTVITFRTADGWEAWQYTKFSGTFIDVNSWRKFGGSASVGNTYNVTIDAPISMGYYTLEKAIAKTYEKGFNIVGIQITFAIADKTWKMYQYIGADTSKEEFEKTANWIDMAGMSAGDEAIVNIDAMCGPCQNGQYYTLEYAIAALQDVQKKTGIKYEKLGLIISYQVGDNKFETKQFQGNVITDFAKSGLWKDFGGGGLSETADKVEKGNDLPVTSDGVAKAFDEKAIVNFEQTQNEDNILIQGVNAKGEPIGDQMQIPKGGGSGQQTGSSLSIYPETQAVWGAVGSRFILRAAIKSVSYDGDQELRGTIRSIAILDSLTGMTLWSETVNSPSSTSATDYRFTFDFTDYMTTASAKDFVIQAIDADGNKKTRTITVTAVDVTCTCIHDIAKEETAVKLGEKTRSLPMYAFEKNVSTKQGITVKTEIFFEGEWRTLGTAIIYDTYSHNISIDSTNVFGGNERLKHGSYSVRIQGTDNASGVTGNIIYTAVMCIDPASKVPLVSIAYDDRNDGKIRLYDSINLQVAAYTPGATQTTAEVIIDGQSAATIECVAGQTYFFRKQVQGYPSDGSKTLDIFARSGSSQTETITVTVEGSAIDAEMKEGAVFAYDFSTRSNNESDHTISNNGYEMKVEGANWNSNGFVPVLGENALRIAENVTAEIPYAPFGTGTLETSGAAFQMAFSTKSIKDKDAMLCECYDEGAGVGFYIKGNEIGLTVLNGSPKVSKVRFKCNEKVTVAVVVEPGTKYVTYHSGEGAGTNYSFVKLFVNGEECAAIGYQPNTNALRQNRTIKFNSANGDFALNYFIAYNSYMEWLQAFRNYLCMLADVDAMISEYDFENVIDATGKPSLSMMAAKGIPYYVIVADQTTFDNFDYALNGGTNTSDQFACTLYYYNPQHPEVNFKAENVLWRRQGTTSAQRPIKNDRFNFNKKNKNTGLKATVTLLNPDEGTELGRKAIKAAKHNKVYVSETGFFVDVVTVKVDYSDSSNANDCGVCDMMNATFRALGSSYMTPAQRAFTGVQDLGDGDQLDGIQMDHSTKNHPIAVFRATQDTLQDAWFHAKGNWKEDKGEQVALGFQNTPGYNLGCLNYGDFIEYFGTKGESLADTEARFKKEKDLDTSMPYLISQYCGRDYAIYRYKSGAWQKSTGSMKQVGGKWQVTGDVLNPVNGFELLQYARMDWWQGVATVEDMMAPSEQKSSWVTKLGLSATTYPAWTFYFECMIDDDQLQEDLALGKKVPFELFNLLRFFNSCDYSKVNGWQSIWKQNAYKYLSMESAMAYTGFTDYLAAVDQRAKNMQPMFFLEDGCSVTDGVYAGARGMEPLRMYLNKVYDCDTCNGADNDGGRDIDPEVDPNKPTDEKTGYSNPYMGSGSVLFNNIDKEPEVWNSNDAGATLISLKSVINRMRNLTYQIEGKTISPFSPDGALYFFVEKRLKFWPKVISSYDGERKYIDNTGIANLPYFYALHGLGLTSLPRFIEQRWAIRDGYYQTGDFFTNPLSGRVSALTEGSKIHITAAATGYFGIGNDASGQLSESIFLEAGQSHAFTKFAHDAGALLYIYQPGRMSKIDLSEMSVDTAFSNLGKLELAEEIILGGNKHTSNKPIPGFTLINSITLGEMPFLRRLDVSGTTATTIDAKGCPRVEEIDAENTSLTSCTIAQTSPIEKLVLPSTIIGLELVNLPKLTYPGGLSVAGFGSVNRLWVEGCKFINTESLILEASNSNRLQLIRIPGLNITASVDALRSLKAKGVIGMSPTGGSYSESGKCSGITGRWICTQLVDESELSSLADYFPELTIYNSQFSMVVYDDTVDDPANLTNLDNNTGYGTGKAYVASGHIKLLEEKAHAYRSIFNSVTGVMRCTQISDDDYNYMADGSTIDLSDASNMGYDIMKHIPPHWYKGISDFKNQKKYAVRSMSETEPISSASRITRKKLSEILVASGAGLHISANPEGSKPTTTVNASTNIYEIEVTGMKQVRWPGINSPEYCCLFLNEEGNIISQFQMQVAHTLFDFTAGEDYIFCDVPADAVKFMFTSQTGCDHLEAIAVESTNIEAIEPDWVRCEGFLVGVYHMGTDNLGRARSLSTLKVCVGINSNKSPDWLYDADGFVTNTTPPANLGMSCLDILNLCECRGKGYHAMSYVEWKDLANIIMELTGTRDLQTACSYGTGNGSYQCGSQNISALDIHNPGGSFVTKNINEFGNKTLKNSAQYSVNVMFGIHALMGSMFDWVSGCVMNVKSYKDFKKAKMPDTDNNYPIDNKIWVYDYQTGEERSIQATTQPSGYTIGRVKFGRFMDIVPSKVTNDRSLFNLNYCDAWEYNANSRCRVVARSGLNGNAYAGLVYANALQGASSSSSSYGSRLAFSGKIQIER